MSLEVLQGHNQVTQSRIELRQRGLECITPKLVRALRKACMMGGANVGDVNKSWDVLKTVQYLEQNVDKTLPILDVGAYASEVLFGLHKLGFSDLCGIDLNPKIKAMPFADRIKYQVGDFTNTPFPDSSFQAITAISVLEHGYGGLKFFKEFSRILRPGGYLLASVDYWPEKIETHGIFAFNLDWIIFSEDEMTGLLRDAASVGLTPVGNLNFLASDRVADWQGKQYTYAWFVLQKAGSERVGPMIPDDNLFLNKRK